MYGVLIALALMQTSFAAQQDALYDSAESKESLPKIPTAPPLAWKTILGYEVDSPIGVAANAVTTSKGIATAATLGYDIITYKTVRSKAYEGYPKPHICHVGIDHMLQRDEIYGTFHKKNKPSESPEQIAISNSMGMGCRDCKWVSEDIANARASIGKRQLLIVSVFGDGQNEQAVVDDFVSTAQMVQDAGAQVVELNLSCPNLGGHTFPYKNFGFSYEVVAAVVKKLSIPVSVKVGVFDNKEQMEQLLTAIKRAGARGVCGINTVPVKIVNEEGKPFFGDNRQVSGLSGAPLRQLAKEFIQNAREIIDKNKLELTLFATGGITTAKDFQQYLDWGADVALTATGFIYNPHIASEFKQIKHTIRLGSKL